MRRACLLATLCSLAATWVFGVAQGAQAKTTAASTTPAAPSLLRGSSLSNTPAGIVQAPQSRFVINNLLVLRVNPVGLEDQMRIGYQVRLSDRTNLLLRDTFVFLGFAPRFNPAFVKIGPSFEVQPLSIFNLRVGAEFIGLFSTFGFLQSYTSPRDDYSDTMLRNCSTADWFKECSYVKASGERVTGVDERRNYSTIGAHVMIEPLIQLKLGPVAFRNKLALEYWDMNVRGGDTVFYDVTLDTLVPARGWVLANDMDLLYVSKFGLTAGVRYSVVKPFYTSREYRAIGEPEDADNSHQRLGPMLAYTFFDRGFTRFNKPTLLLIANWYVSHRYRTGATPSSVLPGVFVNSPAMPYLILGFAFQSDLLKTR